MILSDDALKANIGHIRGQNFTHPLVITSEI